MAFANVANEARYGQELFSVYSRGGQFRELQMDDITLITASNSSILVHKQSIRTLEEASSYDSRNGQLIISIGFEKIPNDFMVIGQPHIFQNGKIYRIEKAYLSDLSSPQFVINHPNLVENRLELALPLTMDQEKLIDFKKRYQPRRRVVLKLIFALTPKVTRFSLQGLKIDTPKHGLQNLEILYESLQTNL
ncbi:hypothetical protein [Parvibium lacunae]|uniref:hypothetical protein n=1 Tax=Parvibium lacunae TaxID=1888893 RepID=UPI001314161B|nr:hypothetical protein [Parvibium lacunae]